ncbi:hypothetical protein E1295_33600, partial [Nonomuraea mesophila]
MRGQEPGSEHDRTEADNSAAPATPPPSFGQTDGRDVPPAFTPSDTASDSIPTGRPPFGTPAGEGTVPRARPAIPVFQGPPPDLPEPEDRPGAQPWEVSGDDAAPYDWFADPTGSDPADQGRDDHSQTPHAFPGRPSAARELLSGPRTGRDHTAPQPDVRGHDPHQHAPAPQARPSHT